MRHRSLHRFTSLPSLCTTRMPLVLPVSLSRVLTLSPPSSPYPRCARDIGLEVSSMRKFAVLYRNSRKFPLQSDIHSLASRLSSITRCWRNCYPLFEAGFFFSLSRFFPFLSRLFFRTRGRCCKFMIRTSDEKITLSQRTRAKSRQRDSFSFAEITTSHSYARACDTH